ncbi:endogenous retrovirus group K member 5 Gag polyprotein-like [Fukomys damarensis]|uniref:endogenous retrovirus group K member 5 Gag polyprotein-like n=1 Tax=Fukomys damarensis TaxID=885580 RepID=UPI00053FC30C|nr:endogenous retrovirus group K member 5 Gag polyprotein-like [Fukomys damarensis]
MKKDLFKMPSSEFFLCFIPLLGCHLCPDPVYTMPEQPAPIRTPTRPRTCAQARAAREAGAAAAAPDDPADDQDSPAEVPDDGAQESDDSDVPDTPQIPVRQQLRQYRALDRKNLKELFQAVSSYGPQAPYTLSCLESIGGGGAVSPTEWRDIVRTALRGDLFVSWEADFLSRCKALAGKDSNLYARIAGLPPFHTIQEQHTLSRSQLANTALAALRAWKSLPRAGAPAAPLSKIIQGPEESFSSFISHLSEAAEHALGDAATVADSALIRQLAFENANETCRAILKNNSKAKTLHNMINLCREADPFMHKITKALVTFQGQNRGKTCFQNANALLFVLTAAVAATGRHNASLPQISRAAHLPRSRETARGVSPGPLSLSSRPRGTASLPNIHFLSNLLNLRRSHGSNPASTRAPLRWFRASYCPLSSLPCPGHPRQRRIGPQFLLLCSINP